MRISLVLMALFGVVHFSNDFQVNAAKRPLRIAGNFEEIETCKNVKVFLQVKNVTYRREKNGITLVDALLPTSKNLKSLSKIEARVTDCADGVSYNTCQYVNTYRFTSGLCRLLTSDSMAWSGVVKAISPPVRCPVLAPAQRSGVDNSVWRKGGPACWNVVSVASARYGSSSLAHRALAGLHSFIFCTS
ncbi:uncharacterized protein LOC113214600 isoform X3 [Frankliniella occidentalis]|uniref:Uncharacterized protein LOC113214600 isoform X3 n=1 Tax=Frankliniella occidentalis TaxID=133901 RepID=A0A9C6X859_FRAOC|nr:uncharacterized protein LOC113214600 isoform X3 [Frankliniella occidentalis]